MKVPRKKAENEVRRAAEQVRGHKLPGDVRLKLFAVP
jgi:hypothetical protein